MNDDESMKAELGCRCHGCDTPFKLHFDPPVDVSVAIGLMLRDHCPHCGNAKIAFGMELTLAEDRELRKGTTIDQRIADWINHGDVGLAARAVVDFMTIGTAPESAPGDYSAVRRIILLLDRVPEWQPRMSEMARFKGWETIAEDWASLMQAISAMDPDLKDPKLVREVVDSILA